MNQCTRHATLILCLMTLSCGGKSAGTGPSQTSKDVYSVFGPLEVGADWQTYTKVNTEPVESQDHGKRFVDTYVNNVGLEAYKTESAEIPVGTIVVKVSWERSADNKPRDKQGPIFVMEKKPAGFDDENENWYYAIHWADPAPKMREQFGQIYWRTPSPRVKYCFDCHNGYDRQLGMVPEGKRAW